MKNSAPFWILFVALMVSQFGAKIVVTLNRFNDSENHSRDGLYRGQIGTYRDVELQIVGNKAILKTNGFLSDEIAFVAHHEDRIDLSPSTGFWVVLKQDGDKYSNTEHEILLVRIWKRE